MPNLNMQEVGRIMLEPLNHGIAAAVRKAFELGVPGEKVIEMLLNHLASVVAMIEPQGARDGAVEDVRRHLVPMILKHYEARMTTAGGVLKPQAVNGLGEPESAVETVRRIYAEELGRE